MNKVPESRLSCWCRFENGTEIVSVVRGFGFENGVGHAVTRLPALRGTLNESAKLMTTTRPLMVGDLRFDRTWSLGWMWTQTSSVVRALRSLVAISVFRVFTWGLATQPKRFSRT